MRRNIDNEDMVIILKRVHRRMQARSVRLLRIVGKHGSMMLHRSYAWQEAAAMLAEEIEALGGQVNG